MKDHQNPRPREAGFSMLELIIVVAIAIALLAFAIPSLSTSSPHWRIENASANLASALRKARFKAISEGRRVRVTFPSATEFRVCEENDGAPGTFAQDCVTRTADADSAVTLTPAANVAPIFNTQGFVDQSGGVDTHGTVTATAKNNLTRAVAVSAAGSVSVQ